MGAPNWTAVVAPGAVPPAPAEVVPPVDAVVAAKKVLVELRARNAAKARKVKDDARKLGRALPHGQDPYTSEIDYSAAEVEFANALDKYKRQMNRPFPTNREILKVLLGLGYRKE